MDKSLIFHIPVDAVRFLTPVAQGWMCVSMNGFW